MEARRLLTVADLLAWPGDEHDLAGWRKERMRERPSGVMTLLPDWVCEILSPEHKRTDTVTHFLRLQRAGVPPTGSSIPKAGR